MKYFFRKLYKRITWKSRVSAAHRKWMDEPLRREAKENPKSEIPAYLLRNSHRLWPFNVRYIKATLGWDFSKIEQGPHTDIGFVEGARSSLLSEKSDKA